MIITIYYYYIINC